MCEKIIFHLQNNRRIYHDKTTDIIYDNNDGKTDFETIYCLWVICDFIEKIEYHSISDFPVNAVFFAEGELYELSFIPENKETMFEQAFKTQEPDGKRIIVLESTDTKKPEYLASAGVVQGIDIREENDASEQDAHPYCSAFTAICHA